MKKCALYRCKQCFATMADEGDARIDKDIVDWMFENEMEESKIGFISDEKIKVLADAILHVFTFLTGFVVLYTMYKAGV